MPGPRYRKGDEVRSTKAGVTKKVWGSRWDGAEYRYVLVDDAGVRDHGYLENELRCVRRNRQVT